jgi:hypothetical protein
MPKFDAWLDGTEGVVFPHPEGTERPASTA